MYTYNFEKCKPAPGNFSKYLKELFKKSNIWKNEETNNNQTFTHEEDNGKIVYGFSNFNYFKLGNKENNYMIFNNTYYYPETYVLDNKRKNSIENIKSIIKNGGNWILKAKCSKFNHPELVNANNCDLIIRNLNDKKYILQKLDNNIDLVNNKKYDFYAYVIFVKNNRNIKPFLFNDYVINSAEEDYNENKLYRNVFISNKQDNFVDKNDTPINNWIDSLIITLKDASNRVISSINKINNSYRNRNEILITRFNLLMTKNGKFKILEFTSTPNLFENSNSKKIHQNLVTNIFNEIINPLATDNEIKTKYLIDICDSNLDIDNIKSTEQDFEENFENKLENNNIKENNKNIKKDVLKYLLKNNNLDEILDLLNKSKNNNNDNKNDTNLSLIENFDDNKINLFDNNYKNNLNEDDSNEDDSNKNEDDSNENEYDSNENEEEIDEDEDIDEKDDILINSTTGIIK